MVGAFQEGLGLISELGNLSMGQVNLSPDHAAVPRYITIGVEVYDFEKSAREALGSIWVVDVLSRGDDTRP